MSRDLGQSEYEKCLIRVRLFLNYWAERLLLGFDNHGSSWIIRKRKAKVWHNSQRWADTHRADRWIDGGFEGTLRRQSKQMCLRLNAATNARQLWHYTVLRDERVSGGHGYLPLGYRLPALPCFFILLSFYCPSRGWFGAEIRKSLGKH